MRSVGVIWTRPYVACSSSGYRRGEPGGQSQDRGKPNRSSGVPGVWESRAGRRMAQERRGTNARRVHACGGPPSWNSSSARERHCQIHLCRVQRGRTTPPQLWPWSSRFDLSTCAFSLIYDLSKLRKISTAILWNQFLAFHGLSHSCFERSNR